MAKQILPQPFFFEKGPKAVLLMHAYTGSPNDVRMMGRALEKENYTVYAPMFKGHGTLDPEDILTATTADWIQDAKDALQFLAGKGYQYVAVFGLSLGGVIATKMMTSESILASGTFSSPTINDEESNLRPAFLRYVRHVKKQAGQTNEGIDSRMVLVEEKLNQQLAEISEMVSEMQPAYQEIIKPIFIAQSGQDELINPQIAVQFKEKLIHAKIDFKWYENSTHVITVGVDRRELEKDVLFFLSDLNWNGE
ncbi:carboxylesterase [Carnobacterium iners]|uniref:Carboxylesterase n=1 Tax=Carnobacterium iners TaxID=1073423 RepID=A0A1X7MS20_9LACT|nr:alpha/beta fold hydrolase [Carnobacterium iners]SEL29840.1 carboxylesterase [Carnobacterium iners]SMH26753.1 carboxylesterase [Carnobacterium iners]